MNHLHSVEKLHNRYFVLRHGESKANTAKIVLSHLQEGKKEEWSLTPRGEIQVRNSVSRAKVEGLLNEDTIIYSSPFSRTKRSAEIAKEVLNTNQEIFFDDRLRERWFGNFEKTHNSSYEKIWQKDKDDPGHTQGGVESTLEVQKRVTSLVVDLEKKYSGKTILLVSHGDALQILQTGFNKKLASTHRDLVHLETAEIRELKI